LPRLSDRADATHQTKLVLDGSLLGDLVPFYAAYGEMPVNSTSCLSGGHPRTPLVGGTGPPASYHLFPFCYEVLYGAYHVREAATEMRSEQQTANKPVQHLVEPAY
jgi:hypothetical protein